jgi:cupin fold WbuC family metalloprotein
MKRSTPFAMEKPGGPFCRWDSVLIMIATRPESPEVLYPAEDMILCEAADWEELKRLALANPRRRIRLCAHRSPSDTLHEMLIVHTRDAYVRPHKHVGRIESFLVLEGDVDVVLFDEAGNITNVIPMGAPASGKQFYLRMNTPTYHTLVIRSEVIVFHEATNGPFNRADTVFAPWSPDEANHGAIREYMTRLLLTVNNKAAVSPVHLVVGADGLIGGALVRRFEGAGASVAGTTRRKERVSEHCAYLDLARPSDKWKFPWPVDVAILCAGVNKLQLCKDQPEATAKINVEAVSKLAGDLVEAGAFVIYLSTSQVFDGSRPCQAVDAPYSPMTEYGRQKAEVERRLSKYGDSVAIVRFAKILGPQPSLFSEWATALRKGEAIHPFSDMTLAPAPLSHAVSVLTRVAELRLPGIFQVSGSEDITYAEAARLGAKALGADPRLVQPVASSEEGTYTEAIPAHTSLNMDRLYSATGIVPPTVQWTVETAFINPQLLTLAA